MKFRLTSALFACLVLPSVVANAQISDGERKAAARAAYAEGVELQDKGRPADALTRFEAAQKLFDAHTHLLHIAECQALTGKLVEASETYETLVRKPLGDKPPEAFMQAQQQGKTELTSLRLRIPTMRIVVKPEPTSLENLQININDKAMPSELVGIARPVNPGTYTLTATATGWGMAAPVQVDVKEKEAQRVELSLRQGQTMAVAPAVVQQGTASPPLYEHPAPSANEEPSATGLLIGVRPGVFVPSGSIAKNQTFSDVASAGPGIGIDLFGRVARRFLVGGTLEFASFGAPSAKNVPDGTRTDINAHTFYLGVLAGILPNVDRVSFIGDAGFGYRSFSRDATATLASTTTSLDESYSGLDLTLNAGLSIPAGPIRIAPKAGVSVGQFTNRDCTLNSDALSGCTTDGSATHAIVNLVVGLYFPMNFKKKSSPAQSSPPSPSAPAAPSAAPSVSGRSASAPAVHSVHDDG